LSFPKSYIVGREDVARIVMILSATEGNVDAQYAQKRLRSAQAASERAEILGAGIRAISVRAGYRNNTVDPS
jgi:hypothetical protein